jgi:hypothetical protein
MSERLRVSVIVAATDARATVAASLRRFAEEVQGRGEVLLVDASRDGTAIQAARAGLPGVRFLERPAGRLVPQLWQDGIDATDAPLVALSTAAMIPQPGWLDALLRCLDATGAAGVGGPIEPAPGLAPFDRAVYLLRYVNYLRPWPRHLAPEPPGDNALYRRDRLGTAGARGFWETEVHRDLDARGESLAMTPEAVVRFHGGTRPRAMTAQRRVHARYYGAQRALRMGRLERLTRTAAAPAVPLLMVRRICTTLAERGEPLGRWMSAFPWLGVLLTAWSAGEACGTWLGPPAEARPTRDRAN